MSGSTRNVALEWSMQFNVSLQSDTGDAKWQNVQSGSFLDLSGGGGNTPAIHVLISTRARDKGNPNEDWATLKVAGTNGLIIVNVKNKRIIIMTDKNLTEPRLAIYLHFVGPKQLVACNIATADAIRNPSSQWERRQHTGGDNNYWLICKGFNGGYCLDLAEGKSQNGTPVYTYPTSDQKNKLWKFISWAA